MRIEVDKTENSNIFCEMSQTKFNEVLNVVDLTRFGRKKLEGFIAYDANSLTVVGD